MADPIWCRFVPSCTKREHGTSHLAWFKVVCRSRRTRSAELGDARERTLLPCFAFLLCCNVTPKTPGRCQRAMSHLHGEQRLSITHTPVHDADPRTIRSDLTHLSQLHEVRGTRRIGSHFAFAIGHGASFHLASTCAGTSMAAHWSTPFRGLVTLHSTISDDTILTVP